MFKSKKLYFDCKRLRQMAALKHFKMTKEVEYKISIKNDFYLLYLKCVTILK